MRVYTSQVKKYMGSQNMAQLDWPSFDDDV
jgi:hypothetical protein